MIGTALALASGAFNIYQQYQNKPKKDDYVPSGGMYQRYLDHLKSKTAESTVYHQQMRPALRQIGAQTQQANRGIDQFSARNKPGGGVEAQMRLGVNQQALQALGLASEKASFAQQRVNEQTGEQLLRIGIQEEQALKQYRNDKQRWAQQMVGTGVQAGLSVASAVAADRAAANAGGGRGGRGGSAGTLEKTEAAMDVDYNNLSLEAKAEVGSREDYGKLMRSKATSVPLEKPDNSEVVRLEGGVEQSKMHRDQFDRGTEDWKTADSMYKDQKKNLREAEKTYRKNESYYKANQNKLFSKESTGDEEFAGTMDIVSSAFTSKIKSKYEKEAAFQEKQELKNLEIQSATITDKVITAIQGGDRNFDELEMNFENMDVPDIQKYFTAKRDAIKGELPDPSKPLQTEFTDMQITSNLPGMIKVASDIYKNPLASNEYKLATYKYIRGEQDRIIADRERRLASSDRENTKALALEIKGLKADADKQSMMFLLSAESGANSTYKEGRNAQGKFYAQVGSDALNRAQTTLSKVKFTNGAEGFGANAATGMKRDVITWAQSIKWEDASILDMFSNISIDKIDKDMKLGDLPLSKSPSDKKAITLIKEWLGRIDALYTQMPYDDTDQLIDFTRVP